MIKKSINRKLLADLCRLHAQQAVEQAEREERAAREQVMRERW